VLVYVGYGALGAITGYTFSFLTSGYIWDDLTIFIFLKNLKRVFPQT